MTGLDHVLSMLDGPDLTERRRGELTLVRLMVTAIEMILYTGDSDLDITNRKREGHDPRVQARVPRGDERLTRSVQLSWFSLKWRSDVLR